MGIKSLLRQYIFTVFVIFCATVLLCGIISVKERTQYNIDMSGYPVLEISRGEDIVIITAGTRRIELKRADFDLFG